MKKRTLAEALDALQVAPLNEFMGTGSPAGASMDQRPDMSGFRGKGAKFNYEPRQDQGPEWPYEDTGYMQYGRTMGNKGRDRGDRGGEDMSGGPPTPKLQSTWEGGPEEVEEGPDYDETQRHGDDKYRDVWRDTPDGKQWTELNKEGVGSPGRIGPFAPMDAPSMSSAQDARPVEDKDGNPIAPQYLPNQYKDMSGPGNMWGGPGTIPGATQGWANAPSRPEDEDDPEKNPMKLREFFNPEPVPVDEVENDDPANAHDQSDEELEGPDFELGDPDESEDDGPDLDDGPEPGGFDDEEDGDDFGGPPAPLPAGGPPPPPPEIGHGGPERIGGVRLNVLPKSGPQDLHAGGPGADLVDKSSAWDVLQKVVDALGEDDHGMGHL